MKGLFWASTPATLLLEDCQQRFAARSIAIDLSERVHTSGGRRIVLLTQGDEHRMIVCCINELDEGARRKAKTSDNSIATCSLCWNST